MHVGVDEAKERLEELLDRVAAGEQVVIERGAENPCVFLLSAADPCARRRAAIERVRESARRKEPYGPDAAHAADFLYGKDGLPV